MLIAIEGLDGSGKATQTKLLCDALQARRISFPNYDSDSSALVKMYLAGEFGSNANDVNAYAASSFFAVDRYASYRQDWQKDYEAGVVIADRYTTSNAIHQCCKLERPEWDTYLEWLFDFEFHRLGIPEPDAVIYLRVDPQVSQELMTRRYANDEGKKDIHERDLTYLSRARLAADYCAAHLGWQVVECCADGHMRSIEEIHAQILAIVSQIR